MGALLQFVGDWGHALAAALFAAIGILCLRRRTDGAPERILLAAALLITSSWALSISFGGVDKLLSGIMESLRNGAWLLLMFVMLRRGEGRQTGPMGGITAVYAVVGVLLLLQCFADMIWHELEPGEDMFRAFIVGSLLLRMMTAVGGLVLVHNLFSVAAAADRARLALLLGGLAAMWTYDLNLYAIGYFTDGKIVELYALRGVAMALLAPLIAVALHRDMAARLSLSRTVTLQSLSIVAIGAYVLILAAAIVLIERTAGPYARVVEIGGVFVMTVAALVLWPSPRLRALVKVQVAKHFFQHRYDYRLEWMRFGDTIGRPGEDAAALGVRVVKAVADITEAPGGMLLLREDAGGLTFETSWNWPDGAPEAAGLDAGVAATLERTGWIVDLRRMPAGATRLVLPEWVTHDRQAWALVPLIHFDRLIGVILLARPAVDRRLDWEDFDMLRAAGRQAASYISEAQGQQALDDAQRFEEFNRRFAFIMHDVKNLVSQLSLLARNAERHVDNPAFRADMVLTVKDSVGKMNELLARLSQHNKARAEEPRAVAVADVIAPLVRTKSRLHPVELRGESPPALADPVRLEQILTHLIQNAIDASPAGQPVRVVIGSERAQATIAIIDEGCGMSAEFIRRDLFKPFASSKAGGFGIGAFEARALALSMDGTIEVDSRPGAGSRFMLRLPLAPAAQTGADEKMMTGKAA